MTLGLDRLRQLVAQIMGTELATMETDVWPFAMSGIANERIKIVFQTGVYIGVMLDGELVIGEWGKARR